MPKPIILSFAVIGGSLYGVINDDEPDARLRIKRGIELRELEMNQSAAVKIAERISVVGDEIIVESIGHKVF